MYRNDTQRGGRPNVDEVLMVKLLVLQQWIGLSDMELEKQALNRLDFQHFLGFPEPPADYSTVWQFRERLAATRTDELVWRELQRQLDEKGLKARKGVAQDASIIEADPGQSSGKPRGDDALTRRSRDGDWAKRLQASFFGFKLHVKTDLDHGLVRAVEATPACS
jgi:IS5 family transposase